jgi:HK97 family phage prohead protease
MYSTQLNLWAPSMATDDAPIPAGLVGAWTLQRGEDGTLERLSTVGSIMLRRAPGSKLQNRDDLGRLPIRILASTEAVNDYGFIVENAALVGALEEFNSNPVILAYHDMKQPIGKGPSRMTELGLVSDAFVSSGRPDIQTFVLDGTLSGASIAFNVNAQEDGEDNIPRVTKLSLIEISLVPAGANRDAYVEAVAAPEPEVTTDAAPPPAADPVSPMVESLLAEQLSIARQSSSLLRRRLAWQRESINVALSELP